MKLDLLDGALYAGDPEPAYAWLRDAAPAYRDEANELWAVSRHADVIAVESDPERFTSSRGFRPKLPSDASMIGKDDPEHGAQRRLLNRRFTPRAARSLEPRVRAAVVRLVDGFARRGHCDLVRELATPLPVIAILELLGFDAEEWPRPQLAFGFGTHFCLEASLARLELRVVFEELLRRLPDLRLAPGAEPRVVPNPFTRGLASLPLEFAQER